METVVDIVQAHGAFDDIFPVGDPAYELVLCLVIFIMDLAHDLFQDILQCDQACHLAVLIEHDRDIKGRVPHLHEQFRNTFILIGKMRLAHDVADVEGLVFIIQQQILHINNADDIVLGLLVDRQAGELVLAEDLDQLFVGVVHVRKCNVYAGNHDVLCVRIAQVEYIIDHLFLIGLYGAVFMADIHDGAELVLCDPFAGRIRVYPQQEHDAPGKQIDDKDHRRHDSHKETDDPDISERQFFGVYRCVVFWRDLAEHKDRNCKDCGRDADHIAAECVCERCGKCGCGKVNDIISDQDRAEHLGSMVFHNIEHHCGPFVPGICQCPQLQPAH